MKNAKSSTMPMHNVTSTGNIMDRSEHLAELLRSSGLTAAALAKQIGMSASNLSKYLALQLLSPADKARVAAGCIGLAEAYRSLRRPRITPLPT